MAAFALVFCTILGAAPNTDDDAKKYRVMLCDFLSAEKCSICTFEARSLVKIAVGDTPIAATVMWQCAFSKKTGFEAKPAQKKSQSIFDRNTTKWIEIDSVDFFPHKNITQLAHAMEYPYVIARRNFAGYTFKIMKKQLEISGIECVKIAVKPVDEDNPEEYPFSGFAYISIENPRLVRLESIREGMGFAQQIRWDFQTTKKGFAFPKKIAIGNKFLMGTVEFEAAMHSFFDEPHFEESDSAGKQTEEQR